MINDKVAKAPQPAAQRQAVFRARKAAQGMTEVRGIFASPEHAALIKCFAGQLKTDCYN